MFQISALPLFAFHLCHMPRAEIRRRRAGRDDVESGSAHSSSESSFSSEDLKDHRKISQQLAMQQGGTGVSGLPFLPIVFALLLFSVYESGVAHPVSITMAMAFVAASITHVLVGFGAHRVANPVQALVSVSLFPLTGLVLAACRFQCI